MSLLLWLRSAVRLLLGALDVELLEHSELGELVRELTSIGDPTSFGSGSGEKSACGEEGGVV